MNYIDQKPINSDGDAAGNVLALNRHQLKWFVISWRQVDAFRWPCWEPLPAIPEVPPLPKDASKMKPAAVDLAREAATPAHPDTPQEKSA